MKKFFTIKDKGRYDMVIYYKYKWNRKHSKLTKFEKNREGVVYKEVLSDKNDYIIIKYIAKDAYGCKTNTVKYKVKIWSGGRYQALKSWNNPREAINYIKEYNNYVGCVYA